MGLSEMSPVCPDVLQMDLEDIVEKIQKFQRITPREALYLFTHSDLISLGSLANQRRFALHPELRVTYVVDRNINYTNICVSKCRFCAFYRPAGHPEGYVLSKDVLAKKIQETIDLGGTQILLILLQGGIHPDLDLDFYIDMLEFIRDRFAIHVHRQALPPFPEEGRKSSAMISAVRFLRGNAMHPNGLK